MITFMTDISYWIHSGWNRISWANFSASKWQWSLLLTYKVTITSFLNLMSMCKNRESKIISVYENIYSKNRRHYLRVQDFWKHYIAMQKHYHNSAEIHAINVAYIRPNLKYDLHVYMWGRMCMSGSFKALSGCTQPRATRWRN